MEGTFQLHRPNQRHREFALVIVLVSRIQISRPAENSFVKWKGTFRSDRQMRSVSVKARIAKTRTIRACAKAGWGQCFFPSAGRVTLLHETGFLHIKGINTHGIWGALKCQKMTLGPGLQVSFK